MKTLTFNVEGMHCYGCAGTVQSVLSAQPGVEAASVTFESREARVLFDANVTNENRLLVAVRDAGFEVSEGCP